MRITSQLRSLIYHGVQYNAWDKTHWASTERLQFQVNTIHALDEDHPVTTELCSLAGYIISDHISYLLHLGYELQ